MFETLRHTFLLLTVLCLMAACDKQEPEIQRSAYAMEFDVADLSRATLTTSQNITESPFAVFGDMKFIESSEPIVLFNGSEVSFDGLEWKYGNTQYWFPNHDHSFVALHPATAPCLSDMLYSDSQLKFTYTYPIDSYHGATDLLIAAHRRHYTEGDGTADPVRFSFSHILSNINVEATYTAPDVDDPYLILTGITFKNIPAKATYAITPARLTGNSLMTADCEFDNGSFHGWTVTGRDDLKFEFSETGPDAIKLPANNDPYKLFSTDDDPLLLLPNPKSPTEMVISYKIYEKNGSVCHTETATVTIPKGWNPGQTYNLSLSFSNDNNKVQFSFTVAEWKDTEPINTTVPRK